MDASNVTCSGNGDCDAGICSCNTGYTQNDCSECDAGYSGYPSCVQDPDMWPIGVAMCQVAAFLYACGICTQRFALTVENQNARTVMSGLEGSVVIKSIGQEVKPPTLYSKYRQHIVWFGGFSLWGMGNAVYTLGLNYAALALMMSMFDTVLVFNALLANWFLQEKITRWDITGWTFIGIGIGFCACFMPKKNHDVSADQLLMLTLQGPAVLYEVVVCGTIIGLTAAIQIYERTYPIGAADEPPTVKLAARLAYPTVLALYESLIQLCLKGVSNMLSETILKANNQLTNWKFWLVFSVMGAFVLAVMFWMRKGYGRFEAVNMLPVQMAVLTTATVIGGLMFYQEYKVRYRVSLMQSFSELRLPYHLFPFCVFTVRGCAENGISGLHLYRAGTDLHSGRHCRYD
eukprot:SAG31_NODE_465_length_15313_cov_10.762390_12_plen_403_part_00